MSSTEFVNGDFNYTSEDQGRLGCRVDFLLEILGQSVAHYFRRPDPHPGALVFKGLFQKRNRLPKLNKTKRFHYFDAHERNLVIESLSEETDYSRVLDSHLAKILGSGGTDSWTFVRGEDTS